MAYRSRRWQCPDCEAEFAFLHEVVNGVEEPPPDFCPKCGAYMGLDPQPLPSQFSIPSARNKSPDLVYREMERTSADRAQQAADILNVPVAEVSDSIKITNLRDNLREGDVAAMPKINPVSKAMDQPGGKFGFQAGPQVALGASKLAMTSGADAGRHGNTARQSVNDFHRSLVPVVRKTGQR